MSDIIKLLPDSVANQIAAGEVIQRPASVIKELVENSVDAGASRINIIIKDAGRTLIQVIDNGKGMSPTDLRMAFERHATSKITSPADLFNLHTMGFRGEALPSICAVSQIEVRSKTTDSQLGTLLNLNASRVENQEAVMCDTGTNIQVKNLFFNVPARRKFLKSDSVELSNILREFERLALVNHNIHLTVDYGTKNIDLRTASFKQRIADIWKNSIENQLLPVEVNTSLVNISGFISRPEFARRRNPLQYLIVNGRNMRHPYFHKAIAGCYESLIATDTQPCYFLKFTVDPTTIDVNIHPTKNEIKFEHEQEIWPIIRAAVKAALGHFGAGPALDFTNDMPPVRPLAKNETPAKPTVNLNKDYSPFPKNNFKEDQSPRNQHFKTKDWEFLYRDFMNSARGLGETNKTEDKAKKENGNLPGMDTLEVLENSVMQHFSKYIVTSSGKNILIINQRRAHIKILYEEFIHQMGRDKNVSQGLMFPDFLNLDESQLAIFENIIPELESIGFKLEKDGDLVWKINAVPAMMIGNDFSDVILSIIENLMEDSINFGKNPDIRSQLKERIALVMARKAAIPNEKLLSNDEMENIVSKLFSLEDPSMTPDGYHVYMTVENRTLEKFFS